MRCMHTHTRADICGADTDGERLESDEGKAAVEQLWCVCVCVCVC